ncbi:hypothetical protein KP509_14G027100 [Ceratopteris richardii]|uniref:Pentatricopeptide repeat-containing protein n=1 Tax=Ceratopteris richardii TaxID=49495 RepID=A0A8T2T8T2_CERRI|nr:hypothetical protein KP509_14G027100 [Ceratopteris richardii]
MFIFRCKQEVPVDCHKLKETIALLDGHETGLKFLSSLLQKCSAAKELLEGKKLHCYLQKNGLLKNLLLGNHLLRMYLSCGSSEDAIACFYSLHEKNGFSWNSLITAHARDGQYQKAICVFYRMQCEGFLPDEFVFASVVSACTKRATITYGKHIHTQILGNEVEFSVPVLNALANMYACHNSITVARKLFDQMLHRNVVSWTCMISAYARIGQCEDAHSLHVRMCQEVALPNRVTYSILLDACLTPDCLVRGRQLHACITTCNLHFDIIMATSLVIMYGKCGTLEDAFKAFACVKDQNTIMWTAMICACTKQGNFNTALLIYNNMLQEGGLPDTVTYSSVLDSCIAKGTLKIVRQIHAALVVNTLPCDIIATTSLLNMYGHHGSLEDASFIFDEMKQRTPSAWTSMIASYTQHGKSKEAIQLYVHMVMDGIPSEIMTFWRVLDACADQGSVIEGRLIHVVLVENGLECNLSLATALVVMYSKCEELEEGHYVFNHMQEKNLTSWTAMISAYAQFGADMEALFLVDEMLQEDARRGELFADIANSAIQCNMDIFAQFFQRAA